MSIGNQIKTSFKVLFFTISTEGKLVENAYQSILEEEVKTYNVTYDFLYLWMLQTDLSFQLRMCFNKSKNNHVSCL